MALPPSNRRPQERTQTLARKTANTAQYIDTQGGAMGAIGAAFSKFAGKMSEEQEKMELIKDQEALDKLYLDIKENPEAATAASRSGDWSAFSISERQSRPSIAKMMPTIAGKSMGAEIATKALEGLKLLKPDDDPQVYLDNLVKTEIQGINNPSIERIVYDTVMQSASGAVADQKQIMSAQHNNRVAAQFRTTVRQSIRTGTGVDALLRSSAQGAAGTIGSSLAENTQAFRDIAIKELLWMAEGGETEEERAKATALLHQDSEDLGGSIYNTLDPIKRETMLRNIRELDKSQDSARSEDFYNQTELAMIDSPHPLRTFKQAMASGGVEVGAEMTDGKAIALYRRAKEQARSAARRAAAARAGAASASPKKSSKEMLAMLRELAAGKSVDPAVMQNLLNTSRGYFSKEQKGELANIAMRNENGAGFAVLQMLQGSTGTILGKSTNIDIVAALPEDSPLHSFLTFASTRGGIRSNEDYNTVMGEWKGGHASDTGANPNYKGAARRMYKYLRESGNTAIPKDDVNPARRFIAEYGDQLTAQWGDNAKALIANPSRQILDYIEQRLNYAAEGTRNISGITEEQFHKTAMQWMGAPDMLVQVSSTGITSYTPVPPSATVDKNGTVVKDAQTPFNPEHLRNLYGSGVGAAPHEDNRQIYSLTTTDSSTGHEGTIVIEPGQVWQVPTREMGKKMKEAGWAVEERNGKFYAPKLSGEAKVGTRQHVDQDQSWYFVRTEQGYEIQGRYSMLNDRKENIGLFRRAFSGLANAFMGRDPLTAIEPADVKVLAKNAPKVVREMKSLIQQGALSPEAKAMMIKVIGDGKNDEEIVGSVLQKLYANPHGNGSSPDNPTTGDKQQEAEVEKLEQELDRENGAAPTGGDDTNHIPFAPKVVSSTLKSIVGRRPLTNYRENGGRPQIGNTQASANHNPTGARDDTGHVAKFESPTQGITSALTSVEHKLTNGAETVRQQLNSQVVGVGTLEQGTEFTEAEVKIVADEFGIKPDEVIPGLYQAEVRAKLVYAIAKARQGQGEADSWKPYINKIADGAGEVTLPRRGSGLEIGHGYRLDWPDTEGQLERVGMKDIKEEVPPAKAQALSAMRINTIMTKYPEWLPGVKMSSANRIALTEYLYTSPYDTSRDRPALLTDDLINAITDGEWDRVSKMVRRETRVFNQDLNSVQKDTARQLLKTQRWSLANKFNKE